MELLCPVLPVSRDHEAVAQEGTQVPVQSSIFLVPKQKTKTLIRKVNSPQTKSCCPYNPQPHPCPATTCSLVSGGICANILQILNLLPDTFPITLQHQVKGWKRPRSRPRDKVEMMSDHLLILSRGKRQQGTHK